MRLASTFERESQVSAVADQQVVGKTGVVNTAIRGGEKPGEARVVIEGLPHYYIAYCRTALAAGTAILVINNRGQRRIDVEPWAASMPATAERPTNMEAI